ncbi:MAG: hypothetical protein ACLRZ9_12010 [Eubacterium sp.]
MEEFSTLEKVKELFNKVNCIGNENCYFVAYKNAAKNSGMVKGMEYPYDALLINQTENGLGIFYLQQGGVPLKYNLSKMSLDENSYFFIKNEDIKSITVKNWAIFNSKTKRIVIQLNNKKVHQLYANVIEKLLPYQNENFSNFIEKYSK